MSAPRISVVMASYNHAAFVGEAVASALGQAGPELEVIVTDDGSCDGTADVVRRVADPRVRLHGFPENRGACVAANEAITRARGDYIAVLNSDDYFLPGKLQRQAQFLEENPGIAAVFGLPQFVDERGAPFRNAGHAFARLFTPENRGRREWLRYFLEHGNALCHPTILIRRSAYADVGLFDPLLMQLPDLDLWIRLCARHEIHVLPERLTAFRILDRELNTSAPSRERLARSAWETTMVLRHYTTLPDDELRQIFPDAVGRSRHVPRVALALEALRVDKPGYAAFGLDLLRECMRAEPAVFSAAEYFRLVGACDPLSAEFFAREHQWLRGSLGVGVARRLVRWWRGINFRR